MSFDLDRLLQVAQQHRHWGSPPAELAAPAPPAEALLVYEQLVAEAATLLGPREQLVAPLLRRLQHQLGALFPAAETLPAAQPESLLTLDHTLNEIEDVVEALLLADG